MGAKTREVTPKIMIRTFQLGYNWLGSSWYWPFQSWSYWTFRKSSLSGAEGEKYRRKDANPSRLEAVFSVAQEARHCTPVCGCLLPRQRQPWWKQIAPASPADEETMKEILSFDLVYYYLMETEQNLALHSRVLVSSPS